MDVCSFMIWRARARAWERGRDVTRPSGNPATVSRGGSGVLHESDRVLGDIFSSGEASLIPSRQQKPSHRVHRNPVRVPPIIDPARPKTSPKHLLWA